MPEFEEVGGNPFFEEVEGNPFAPQPKTTARRKDKSILRKIDAGVRGAADMLSFGLADEAQAGVNALASKGGTFQDRYRREVADQRSIDQADREQAPVSRGVGQGAGLVGGVFTGALGNALMPVGRIFTNPGALRAAESVTRAAVAGSGLGGLSAFGNAEGGKDEKFAAAIPGAVIGAGLGAASVPAGALIGAGVNMARRGVGNALTAMGNPRLGATVAGAGSAPIEVAANALRARTNVPQARIRAQTLQGAGANPAFVSATDEAGRGFIGAAANRMTPGREIVQQRAEASALNLPGRISRQARANLSPDPRTPNEIATALATNRRTQADTAFNAVRSDPVTMAPSTIQSLRTGQGREAIAEASRRERDPEVRAALNRLANDALDDPSTQITVGMADRISRVLAGKAQAAARAGDNDLASTLGNLSRDIREPVAGSNAGYRSALDNYAQESRVMEAADTGEDFLRRNTDEFVESAPGPGQPGNDLARATARRAIERASGENISSAPGVARSLAIAPEQQIRNRAILTEPEAQRFEAGMAAEARVNRDLQDVAPRNGSKTAKTNSDMQTAAGLAQVAQTMAGGPTAWLGAAVNRLKTVGLSDADAAVVADVATDPTKLADLLAAIERQPGGSQAAETIRRALASTAARDGGEMSVPSVSVSVEGMPQYGSGVAY